MIDRWRHSSHGPGALVDGRSIVIDPIGHERPAEIQARAIDIDLIAAARAVPLVALEALELIRLRSNVDVLYHLDVLLAGRGLSITDAFEVLNARRR